MSGPPAPRPKSAWRGWLPLIVGAGIYAGIVTGAVVVRTSGVSPSDDYETIRAKTTSDFRDYWFTARHFRKTGELSQDFGVHSYLPFFTIFMMPWSFLPLPVAAAGFTLFSLGLVALMVVMVESLLGDGLGPRPRAATWVALALMLPYAHSAAVLGSVSLLIAFLVIVTWFLFERGRWWEAGGALGLATLTKVVPGLLVLFFLLKRRWRVAAAAVGLTVALGAALPLASLGLEDTVEQHRLFLQNAEEHSAWPTISAEEPRKIYYKNSALPAILRRVLTETDSRPAGDDLFVNVADLPPSSVFILYAVVMLAVLVPTLAAALRPPRSVPRDVVEGQAYRAQFGVWCCALLLAAPLLWTHYLPLAYWPLALIADRAERALRARRQVRWRYVAALILWLGGIVALALPAARALGAQWLAVGALWLTLLPDAFERSRQAAAPAP